MERCCEAVGFSPLWAEPTSVHQHEERTLAHTRAVLLGLWRRPHHRWVVHSDRVMIPVDDARVGAGLFRTIPDSLLLGGSTNSTLIVRREGLERLMGVSLRRSWWRRKQARGKEPRLQRPI